MVKLLVISALLITGVLTSIFFFVQNKQIKPLIEGELKPPDIIENTAVSTPTPFPFEELTIPYLRNRSYSSSIGNLELVSENSEYSSFLTNYTSDGLKINALLTIPNKDSGQARMTDKWPAVIFVHGYIVPAQYKTLVNYASFIDFMARDLVVFKIDLRGHGDSQGEPTGAYYSSDYVIDILNAYSALETLDFVNKEKIGLWGHSMGGNVVMRAFAAKPEIPKVVIWAGAVYSYTDFQEFGISDSSYRPPQLSSERVRKREELFNTYGQPVAGSDFWAKVAPTTYLNDLEGQLEIHHAIDDNVVGIGYSRNLMSLLDSTSVYHKLYEYKIGGHNLTGSSFTQAMQRTADFLKSH